LQLFSGGLWKDSNFLKLWFGETISLFGSEITLLALPLTAVVFLHASPVQMGYMNAASFLPFLLITLFAGVLIDRKPRKIILVFVNFGRFFLLLLIPLFAYIGLLRMEFLYLITFMADAFDRIHDDKKTAKCFGLGFAFIGEPFIPRFNHGMKDGSAC
jgi:MFS family permease